MHQKNQGVSAARNTGLDHCHGEYILFVDSDDYISSNLINDMISKSYKNSSDMIIFNIYELHPSKRLFINYWKDEVLTVEKSQEKILCGIGWNIFNKMYKYSLWEHIRFPQTIRVAEDLYVMADILSNPNIEIDKFHGKCLLLL
uniref:Glycos_transf_2 n=1 Tax=uncultured Methylotenera sp. TaxID=429431 RepID=A0A060C4B2_9PROT|nr:Glycos_transf_2 [uncultured Methylotenera sp.]